MRIAKSLVAVVLLMCSCSIFPPYGPNSTNSIPNFAVVDAKQGIYRGGQPTDDGWKYLLNDLGITNDVKLNYEVEFDNFQFTPRVALHIYPISFWRQQIGPVSKSDLDKAVAAIGPGTYAHCEHGQDRTGLVVACYRVKVEGWTKSAAEKEMLSMGFHKELFGLWWFWKHWKP